MISLRDEIAEIVREAHREAGDGIMLEDQSQEAADRILSIPALKEAMRLLERKRAWEASETVKFIKGVDGQYYPVVPDPAPIAAYRQREKWLVEQLAGAWECEPREVRKSLDKDVPRPDARP